MSMLRSRARRGVLAALVVTSHGGLQAAFVAVAPRLPLDAGAIAPAAASALVMLVAAAALWTLALRAVARGTLLTLFIVGLVVGASAVVAPVALPVVVALASPLIAVGSPSTAAAIAPGAALAWVLIGVGAVGLIGAWVRWAGARTSPGPAQP